MVTVWRCFLLVIYDASRLYVHVYSSSYRLNKEVSTAQALFLCASLDMAQSVVIFQKKKKIKNRRFYSFVWVILLQARWQGVTLDLSR